MKELYLKDFLWSLLNVYDISFAVFLVLGFIIGMKKGFSETFFNLIKNILVIASSLKMTFPLAEAFSGRVNVSYDFLCTVVYLFNFLIFYAGFTISFYLLKKIVEIKFINILHIIFGGIAGLLNSAVIFSMLSIFFTFFPSDYFFKKIYRNSVFGYTIAKGVIILQNNIPFRYFRPQKEQAVVFEKYIEKRIKNLSAKKKKGDR